MTDYSIDSTGPLTAGTIPDADLDRLIGATIHDATETRSGFRRHLNAIDPADLTPADINAMCELIGRFARPLDEARIAKLEAAEAAREAEIEAAQGRFVHIPAPAGARTVDDWMPTGEEWWRLLDGPTIGHGVRVGGFQWDDGVVEWSIGVDRTVTEELSAAQARELARALQDAAVELDRLTGDAPPFQ
jgi:hypothetical protein